MPKASYVEGTNLFPRMLYKVGGQHEIHGGMFAYKIVDDEPELSAALADEWHMTTDEARAEPAPVIPPVDEVPLDAPPTRAELERKATELGIGFDGRTSDAKLAGKIAAKIKV